MKSNTICASESQGVAEINQNKQTQTKILKIVFLCKILKYVDIINQRCYYIYLCRRLIYIGVL